MVYVVVDDLLSLPLSPPLNKIKNRCSSMFTAWRHRLTRKRRYRMLDGDLEQFLLGFDAIRSAQAVPPRWSKSWDERLKRGHEVRVTDYTTNNRIDTNKWFHKYIPGIYYEALGSRCFSVESQAEKQRMFFSEVCSWGIGLQMHNLYNVSEACRVGLGLRSGPRVIYREDRITLTFVCSTCDTQVFCTVNLSTRFPSPRQKQPSRY